MSDLLGLGAQGVRNYSRALSTIGDNIANAQTPGYARRSTVIAEEPGAGQTVLYRNQVSPTGARATGVTRAVDMFLIGDARAAATDAGRASSRLAGLQAAETALDDGGNGVGKAMTAFFNRADELASDPSSPTRRSAFLQSADDVATTFRRTADGLSRAAATIQGSASGAVDQLNTDIGALARINDGLRGSRDGSTAQASLLDERDRLIDSINAAMPVSTTFDAHGVATLTIGGNNVLSGADRATLSLATAADGRLTVNAANASGSFAVAAPSGTLSGLVDAADHIATQRSRLDTLANSFATALNAQHAAGRTAAGNPGAALFTIGAGAADLYAAPLTVSDVAAADAASTNGNALAFGNLRGPNDGEASWNALVAQQSQTVASARAQDSAAATRNTNADAARADVSGVDLDREAAELVRYQQAYQASARVVQTARELMQTIFNSL